MKEFAAFILLILLVVAGWNQPYKAHLDSILGKAPAATPAPKTIPTAVAPVAAPTAPAVAQTVPAATPARDTSWMWNRTAVDAPQPPANAKGGPSRGR